MPVPPWAYDQGRHQKSEREDRLARIAALWRRLQRYPARDRHTPEVDALERQIRAEADAYRSTGRARIPHTRPA